MTCLAGVCACDSRTHVVESSGSVGSCNLVDQSHVVLLGPTARFHSTAPFTPPRPRLLGVSRHTLRRTADARPRASRRPRRLRGLPKHPTRSSSGARAPACRVTECGRHRSHGRLAPRRRPAAAVVSALPPISIHQRPGTRAATSGVDSGERRSGEVGHHPGGWRMRVTTPLRTACDLGRQLWRFDALAALDSVPAAGVPHEALLLEVDAVQGLSRSHPAAHLGAARRSPRRVGRRVRAPAATGTTLDFPSREPQWWVFDDEGVGIFRLDLGRCQRCITPRRTTRGGGSHGR